MTTTTSQLPTTHEEPVEEEDAARIPRRLIKRLRGRARAFTSAFQRLFPNESGDGSEAQVSSILSLVCSLGHLSFRAYNDPSVEGFQEFTTTANRIQYLNYAGLNDAVEGVLKIHLQRARNVLDADFGPGTSDPYVVFATGWSQVASEFKKDDENPVWNSTHYLLIRKNSVVKRDNSKLHIRLYDSDWNSGRTEEREHRQFIFKDDFLGSAFIDMSELKEPGTKNWQLPLHLEGDHRAQKTVVIFSTEFLSFENACEEMGKSEESSAWLQKLEESENECKWTGVPEDIDISRVTFQPVAFINAVNTGTQVWIHANNEAKAMVVAFRGTEANRFKDVINDFRFIPSKIRWKTGEDCVLKLSSDAQVPTIRVHHGFKNCYNSIWSTVLELVYDITEWSKDWTICVTGHSLGGAIATLCAFEFANRLNEVGRTPRIIMMNFGAPRLGNGDFIHAYSQTVKESYRVVNKMDIIHRIPFFLKHVNTEVDFDENGKVKLGNHHLTELQRCDSVLREEGVNSSSVGKSKKLSKKALFRTPGFKGHFEDYYFDVVMRAISTTFQSDKGRLHDFLEGISHRPLHISEPV
eukprot:g3308.t1